MNFAIICGIISISMGTCFLTVGIKEHWDIKNYVLKKDVREAFKDVDWTNQQFYIGGTIMEDAKGNKSFYRVESIDEAIKKLNKKLEDA